MSAVAPRFIDCDRLIYLLKGARGGVYTTRNLDPMPSKRLDAAVRVLTDCIEGIQKGEFDAPLPEK